MQLKYYKVMVALILTSALLYKTANSVRMSAHNSTKA